nr:PASTA domain-containing protein [Jiangella mangrovi]
MIEVPNVIGERVERAEQMVREAGFQPEIVDLIPGIGGGGRGDRIQRQEPEPGTPLAPNSVVRIIHF